MANDLDMDDSFTKEWIKECNVDQYVIAGLSDDIHRFLHSVYDTFDESGEPRMALFLDQWRASCFGFIFHGRENFRELYEVTEEMMDLVKGYAVTGEKGRENPTGLRFAAIYLLYALFFKQPCRPTVKIRLVLHEFKDIQQLIEKSKQEDHYDVVFAWAKLFTEGAFHFTSTATQMGFETAFKMEQKEMKQEKVKKKPTDYFSTKVFSKSVNSMNKSFANYQKIKERWIQQNPNNKNMFPANHEFGAKIQQIISGEVEEDRKPKDDTGERRRALKEKYYTTGSVESYRDKLQADGRMKAGLGNDAGDANEARNEDDEEWAPPPVKRERKYTRKTGKKGRPKGGKKKNLADVEGMQKTLTIVEGKEKKKRGKGGRKRSLSAKKKSDELDTDEEKKDDTGEVTDIKSKGKAKGQTKKRARKSKQYEGSKDREEILVVDVNRDIVEDAEDNLNNENNPMEEDEVDEDNLNMGEDSVEDTVDTNEDPSQAEVEVDDDASVDECCCKTTKWTCIICERPTCNFCRDKSEDSGRFCKRH